MDTRDWWALGSILATMAGVGVLIVLVRCVSRLTRRMESSNTRTRQVVEKYFREIDRARDDIVDARKFKQELLDSMRPPTDRSA